MAHANGWAQSGTNSCWVASLSSSLIWFVPEASSVATSGAASGAARGIASGAARRGVLDPGQDVLEEGEHGRLAVRLSNDDVRRPDDGDRVGEEGAGKKLLEDGQVAERRTANAAAHADLAAVRDDVVAELTARVLDPDVGLGREGYAGSSGCRR